MRTILLTASMAAALLMTGALSPAVGQPPLPSGGGGAPAFRLGGGGSSGGSPQSVRSLRGVRKSWRPLCRGSGGFLGFSLARRPRGLFTPGGCFRRGRDTYQPPPAPQAPREDESQSDEARPTTDADASGSYRSLRYQEKKASTKKAIERKPLPELEDEEPVPMSLADAKLNFETVVQIYLAQKSVDGILKVPAGTTGRLIPVKTGAVDSNSVAFSGQGRYTGLVTGTDLRSGRPVLLEATANMASTSWNVEEIRLLPGAAAPSAQTIRARSLYALAVRRHVRGIVAASKGVFSLKDDVLKKRWVLKLKRIHQNRLVSLGQGRYFTCVEFSETEGDEVVDADIYAAEGKDGWKVERTLIHAVDGVARFAYDENYKIVPVSKRK